MGKKTEKINPELQGVFDEIRSLLIRFNDKQTALEERQNISKQVEFLVQKASYLNQK